MIYNGLKQEGWIDYGNREDVCSICAGKYSKQNKISIIEAKAALRGKLNATKVFRVPETRERVVICNKCLEQIVKKLKE